jgi:syntaxin-binding protein 1
LLEVNNNKYTYNFTTNNGITQKKEAILSETDSLWPLLRHRHKNSKATQLGKGHIKNLKDLSEAMRAMPQYTELISEYSLHIHMIDAAIEGFNKMGLDRIATLEQEMATSENAKCKSVTTVARDLLPVLSDPTVPREDKMRLLIIYIITREGLKDQERKHLMESAKLSAQDQATIANISALGVALRREGERKRKKKKKTKNMVPNEAYDLSRYVSLLVGIITDLVNDKLSTDEFPFVDDAGITISPLCFFCFVYNCYSCDIYK